jgi:anti-sigma regulatory factor (Ser/Thr protein kinase)
MASRRVPVVTFELAAVPASVACARHWVVAFAQEHSSDRDVQERVALAFTEAFTNAVRHAYPGEMAADNDICVAVDVEDGCLEIMVVDHGRGIRAGSSSPGMGAGLGIIAQCCDAFAIGEHQPSGTEIWMRFELAPEGTGR